jgi:hypothetical protein
MNLIGTIGMTPKEVLLEILRLENAHQSFQEVDVLDSRPDLHAAAILFYGSWNRALSIVGIQDHDQRRE